MDNRQRQIEEYYGGEPRTSDWLQVEQASIDQFGRATLDGDWLHMDPVRAAQESPFGGTIAYGFWTLSLLTYFARQTLGSDYPDGALYGLNYGFDRVRLPGIVPVGSRIRQRSRLLAVEPRGPNRFLVRTENTIEVEGRDSPALVAEWLVLIVYPEPSP